MLEAANNDPLRAQEIHDNISQAWWERWLVDRDAKITADKYHNKKAGKRGR